MGYEVSTFLWVCLKWGWFLSFKVFVLLCFWLGFDADLDFAG